MNLKMQMLNTGGGQATAQTAGPLPTPHPTGSGYLDRVPYRSVHFYGTRLCVPLAEASRYLERLERLTGKPPHILCLHDEFSWEDEGTDLAWRLTLVLSEPPPDA